MVFMDRLTANNRSYLSDYCHELLNSSRSHEDLKYYEACARFVAQVDRLRCWSGRVKLLPKAHGFARDGWATESKFCELDFLFHGWKRQKLNQTYRAADEWGMPFADDKALKVCKDEESSFAYEDGYRTSVEEIEQLLTPRYVKMENEYSSLLESIRETLLERFGRRLLR